MLFCLAGQAADQNSLIWACVWVSVASAFCGVYAVVLRGRVSAWPLIGGMVITAAINMLVGSLPLPYGGFLIAGCIAVGGTFATSTR